MSEGDRPAAIPDGTWLPAPVPEPVIPSMGGAFGTSYGDALASPAPIPFTVDPAPIQSEPIQSQGYGRPGYTGSGYTASTYSPPRYTPPSYSTVTTAAGYAPPAQSRDPALTRRGSVRLVVLTLILAAIAYPIGSATGTESATSIRKHRALNQVAAVRVEPAGKPKYLDGLGGPLYALLAIAPGGARPIDPVDSDNGQLDADTFAERTFANTLAGSFELETLNFQVGAIEEWVGTDAIEVETVLGEFDTVADAKVFIEGIDQSTGNDTTIKERFVIPGTPDCWLYQQPALDAAGNRRATIDCRVATISIKMVFFTPGQFDQASEIAALQNQIDALGA